MPQLIDLTGKKIGKLTILKRAENRVYQKGGIRVRWECICECGNHVILSSATIKKRQSCGCTTGRHGKRHDRIYGIWTDMKSRCNNPNRKHYKYYGERGIKVCKEWEEDFMSFYNWSMNNGYDDNLTIDRIDVNGDYCPENCRWATKEQQANNTRLNHLLEYNGETHDITEWAKILGMKPSTLFARINDYHWTIERAFTQPVRKSNR